MTSRAGASLPFRYAKPSSLMLVSDTANLIQEPHAVPLVFSRPYEAARQTRPLKLLGTDQLQIALACWLQILPCCHVLFLHLHPICSSQAPIIFMRDCCGADIRVHQSARCRRYSVYNHSAGLERILLIIQSSTSFRVQHFRSSVSITFF